jgi:hypothetical protein
MHIFEMAQNASIAFRVGSSYKEGLNPHAYFQNGPKWRYCIEGRVISK